MSDVRHVCTSFRGRRSFLGVKTGKLKQWMLSRLAANALPVFVCPRDEISIAPTATGAYEPETVLLIAHLAASGYSDFLIDIGANIGLTSCQSGANFREVHMFEPNPDCVHILRVNTALMLPATPVTVYPFGLGLKHEQAELRVPLKSWGGAYVNSGDNNYDADTLLKKDGFAHFDAKNYRSVTIDLRPARETLSSLFEALMAKGATRGVVKIDVEGFERHIIRDLTGSLPAGMKVAIMFENWLSDAALADFIGEGKTGWRCFKSADRNRIFGGALRWMNDLVPLVRGYERRLDHVERTLTGGTFLLMND